MITLTRHALDWLYKRARIMYVVIQPTECILFASWSISFSLSLQCDWSFTLQNWAKKNYHLWFLWSICTFEYSEQKSKLFLRFRLAIFFVHECLLSYATGFDKPLLVYLEHRWIRNELYTPCILNHLHSLTLLEAFNDQFKVVLLALKGLLVAPLVIANVTLLSWRQLGKLCLAV